MPVWHASKWVHSLCSFGYCNRNRNLGHQGNIYERIDIGLVIEGPTYVHAYVPRHRYVWASMWFAHHSYNRDLPTDSISKPSKRIQRTLTPLAVLTGLAFSLGNNTFLHSSGIALIMSTNLGTPPNPNFFEACARRTFKEIVVLDS